MSRRTCFQTVQSGPLWERRFCMIPATIHARGQWWCWKHAPKSKAVKS